MLLMLAVAAAVACTVGSTNLAHSSLAAVADVVVVVVMADSTKLAHLSLGSLGRC